MKKDLESVFVESTKLEVLGSVSKQVDDIKNNMKENELMLKKEEKVINENIIIELGKES